MDRHYSRFPAGRIGFALLLLRLVDGLGMFGEGIRSIAPAGASSEPATALLLSVGLVASAMTLILGLRTSLAGCAAATCTAGAALYGSHHVGWLGNGMDAQSWLLFVLLFVLSSSLALLGPGGYSLDARLSGWRRIRLSSEKSDRPFSWDIFVT
jgi:uncharacterized membrane protein YphA (DoxX/SURF4 family)